MTVESARRIALITRLVERSPGQTVGRTALMKFLYFLTVLRNVHLGYHFSLYSYGPFDSTVLEDVDYAARLGGLEVSVAYNPVGYGYVIKPASNADSVKHLDSDFVRENEQHIEWVVTEFGGLSATELELASTIVYVRQEEPGLSFENVVDRVHQIKPHFSSDRISTKLNDLQARQILN